MAKRVFELAKDLGVQSKAIVDKCKAEGIPNIQNHMSSISIGLEATIREWFDSQSASAEVPHTAVETAHRVDLAKAKAPARAKVRGKGKGEGEHDGGEGEGGVAIAEDATTHVDAAPAVLPAPPATSVPAAPAAPVEAPVTLAPPAPVRPAVVRPLAEPHAPAPSGPAQPVSPARPMHATRRIDPPAPPAEPSHAAPLAPAALAPTPSSHGPSGPGTAPTDGAHAPHAPGSPARGPHGVPHRPTHNPRMNVPDRPKMVSPAGPKLDVQTPAKLSGPKVVRVEAPEVIDVPRPRRPAGDTGVPTTRPGRSGGAGAGGAPGPGGPPMTEEERNRRNKRRVGGPPGPAGPGAAARGGTGARRSGKAEDAPGEWRTQDLIEREARLSRSEGFLRQRRRDQKLKDQSKVERAASPAQVGGRVRVSTPLSIKDLSAATGVKAADIVKKLFMKGIMAGVNSAIDADQAQEIMIDYDIELEVVEAQTAEEAVAEEFGEREAMDLRPRSPVVTILGHVDHGKTTLLDKIRNTNIAAGEAGGITQSTRAFRVPLTLGNEAKSICFFDTPGHQAFSEMRSRGANMTDVVVLVVSAADGVMPQTIESINHAKAAGVPVVVALNKIDLPSVTDSQVQQILGKLAEQGLNPTEWGGDTEVVRTSGLTGKGVQDLLETLDLQAQLLDLKADFGGPARGVVVEARMEEGRGAVANILVQEGELKVGDIIVAGRAFGRVRDITDDRGERLKKSYPSTPVLISGLDTLPDAGDKFYVVDSLRKAQEAAEQRHQKDRERELATPKVTLDTMFAELADEEVKELRVVVKADVQGSVDVIKNTVQDVTTAAVKVQVLHAAAGGITESDVSLAAASGAVILGFNVIPSGKARQLAEQKKVEIRTYQVIYDLIDDIKKAAEGLLEPELRQEVLGHAEVRKVFKVSKVGAVAGCYVTDGTIERNALIRVTRNDIVIENGRVLEQLKRFKDDAKDVRAGQECGMKIVGYDDIKEGDVLECYKNVEVRRTLGAPASASR